MTQIQNKSNWKVTRLTGYSSVCTVLKVLWNRIYSTVQNFSWHGKAKKKSIGLKPYFLKNEGVAATQLFNWSPLVLRSSRTEVQQPVQVDSQGHLINQNLHNLGSVRSKDIRTHGCYLMLHGMIGFDWSSKLRWGSGVGKMRDEGQGRPKMAMMAVINCWVCHHSYSLSDHITSWPAQHTLSQQHQVSCRSSNKSSSIHTPSASQVFDLHWNHSTWSSTRYDTSYVLSPVSAGLCGGYHRRTFRITWVLKR